jgi:ectoine hydroxylase
VRLETSALRRAQKDYHDNGWHTLDHRLDAAALADVRDSVTRISRMVRPEVVYEDGTSVVRALHGCHRFDEVCAQLVRQPLLVGLAEALTGDDVYVYQFKVNIKSAYEGQEWPWHQDFAFWSIEDGMPADNAVNIAIALDEVHDTNGPLTVLSGSHRLGLLSPPEKSEEVVPARGGGDWREHVSAKLTHTVDELQAKELMADHPPVKLLGPRGTITAFHPSIVHSSSNNLSADRRAMLFITYNAVRNAPPRPTRPEFLVDRDTTPIRSGS